MAKKLQYISPLKELVCLCKEMLKLFESLLSMLAQVMIHYVAYSNVIFLLANTCSDSWSCLPLMATEGLHHCGYAILCCTLIGQLTNAYINAVQVFFIQ